MARNSSRLEDSTSDTDDASAPMVEAINQNKTDLGFPQPTEVVDLPTKGRFYPEGHPLHNVQQVEIRYMTARDEEILNSKTLLQKGLALDKMLQGILVDKNIKIEDMYIGDRNAVVIAARITGYDSDYKTTVVCPVCSTRVAHTFNLLDIKTKPGAEDVEISNTGTFTITLPKTNTKVELKMLNGNDEKAMRMLSENKKKHNLPEAPLMDQLKSIIVSIDGNSSRQFINDFVEQRMLAIQSSFVREEYARITPNLDMKQDFECSACGTFLTIGIPLSTDFFWPNR